MRLAIVAVVALTLTGCFSVYDIGEGAIVQNNYGQPSEIDPETGEPIPGTMAGAADPEGTNSATASGERAQQNSVIIGGKTSPTSDLTATIDAQIRDLITNPAP